ncbi:IQ calmodulin-binding domain-containing protein [Magnaporthiopsis poae ATCC 64411]|uniref:IQ calmodulin-binding domain-containing protein n=1 Tax=Magnaporthiopsis poae (strain ATCC 64411 / 73-15) TaxID=644358 RepID=A0A0C4E3U2_MAGP6|nr:IQ calmodulin-binding domain-containing protein [Magnaporthiopsis poae ATCC 64411]
MAPAATCAASPKMDLQKEEAEKAAGSADMPLNTPKSHRPGSPPPPRDSVSPAAETGRSGSSGSSQLSTRKEYLDSLVPPSADEFNRIAQVQSGREHEHKSKSRAPGHHPARVPSAAGTSRPETPASPVSERRGLRWPRPRSTHSERPAILEDIMFTRAATLIQSTYRGYRVRRQMTGLNIDAGTRWTHAIREARFRDITEPRPRVGSPTSSAFSGAGPVGGNGAEDGKSDDRAAAARRNWKKAAIVARRAVYDQDSESVAGLTDSETPPDFDLSHGGTSQEQGEAAKKRKEDIKARRRKEARTMGLPYFLEMVDQKHRYGSNLRSYHEIWKKSDTHENFFYWLDYGEGRQLDMEVCPRERLEREQVRYLSREERQYYLVTIDDEGRLCWAKNNARIDTTEAWRDSIHGIVPKDDQTPEFRPAMPGHNTRPLGDSSTGASSRDESAELAAARAAKYATPGLDKAKGLQKVRHVSAATIFNKLLRKSVKKNTWIFVADTSFRLYVGVKNSGAFQHSSFLQGGRITAAGSIKIKNGKLKSLSPLSGHYRPPASNFRAFVKSLKETGVDMKHVSISKSYAVLVGLEVYSEARKKGKEMMEKMAHGKEKIVAPEEVAKREEAERDKTESAAKEKAVLEREARERAEKRSLAQLMGKLHLNHHHGDGGKRGVSESPPSGAAHANQPT